VRMLLTVAPAASVMMIGLRDGLGPEGETEAPRVKFPEKPFALVNVTVDEAEVPGRVARIAGLATIVKSGMPTARV